ncbi:hypothetical protein MCOR02_005170 [Pyricularia oryzae]|nr:hypothetical protein MCOR02_005170 [Pyricularia oryzae]KAI6493756.1 hypothetical protein MCOR13_007751 [Pyricularia oryzae]
MPPRRTLPAPRGILRNSPLQSSHASSPRKKVGFVDLTEEDEDSLPTTTRVSSISKGVMAGHGLQAAALRGSHAAPINSSLPSPQSSPSVRAAATLSANKNRISSEGVINPILSRGLPSQTQPSKHPQTLDSYSARPAQARPSSSVRLTSVNPDASPARILRLKPADRYPAKNETTQNVIDLTMDDDVASTQPVTEEKLPSLDDAKAQVSKAIRKVDWSLKNADRLNDQLLFTEELLGWDSSASDSDSDRSSRRERIRGTRYVANMGLLPQALERSSKTGVPHIVPPTKQDRKPVNTPVDRLMSDGIERGFNKDWLRSTIGRKTRSTKFHKTGIDFLATIRKEKRRQDREGDERVRRRVEECDKLHLALTLLARNYRANHRGKHDEKVRGPGKADESTELAYNRKPGKVQSSMVDSSPHSPTNGSSVEDWANAFSILDFDEAGRLRNSSPAAKGESAQSPVSLQQQGTEQAHSPFPLGYMAATPRKGHPKDPTQQQEHQDSPDEISSPFDVASNPEGREYFEESSSEAEDDTPGYPPSQTSRRESSRRGVPSRSYVVHIKREAASDDEHDSNTAAKIPATRFTGPKQPVLAPNDAGIPTSSKGASKKKLAKLPSAPQLHSNPSTPTLRRANIGKDDQDVPRSFLQQSGAQTDHRQSSASKKRKAAEDAGNCPPQIKKPRTLPTANVNNTKSDTTHKGSMASTATSADLREKKAAKNRRARQKKKARKQRQREEEERAAAIIAKKGVKDEQKKESKDEQKKSDAKAPATTLPMTKQKTKKNKKQNNTPVAKSPAKVLSGGMDGRKKQK